MLGLIQVGGIFSCLQNDSVGASCNFHLTGFGGVSNHFVECVT